MKTGDGHEITVGMEVWALWDGVVVKSIILKIDWPTAGRCRLVHPSDEKTRYSVRPIDVFGSRIAAINENIDNMEADLRDAKVELQEAEHEEYIKREAVKLGYVEFLARQGNFQ